MTDIIYIVKESDKRKEIEMFNYVMDHKKNLGKRNSNRNLFLYRVSKDGIIKPANSKIQKMVDLLGINSLPIALTIKLGSLFNNDELAAMFDGVSFQQFEEK
ncbi:hypothetical protein [Liquorilactobacillus hordei]|uniref:Uncharacterized protein n=1 Tax=Liquorilactobacillus hordei DSM 19519 TaxID=1423759 RepID=A0A0R1MJJ4_9LACO|nr:hypothetical protein [Liquorilactobacillus hordei]KRL08128.1 hypothetical protein FC92_GL000643 [Liquorilactobacillus hordei DSM 19519]